MAHAMVGLPGNLQARLEGLRLTSSSTVHGEHTKKEIPLLNLTIGREKLTKIEYRKTKVLNIDSFGNIDGSKTRKFRWKYRDIIDIDKN